MKFNLIVTVGPAIFSKSKLKAIDQLGPCIYRINGSHVRQKETVVEVAKTIRSYIPDAKLLLDLPGNKIRTANLAIPIQFEKEQPFDLHPEQLNFNDFYKFLKIGDQIFANDAVYTFKVKSVSKTAIGLIPFSSGTLTNNKGLHVPGMHDGLPFFFDTDRALLEAATEVGINFIGLSFVRNGADVDEAKAALKLLNNSRISLISKIETLPAVNNLKEILGKVDSILIDRGDLSCDVSMLKMPWYQERIIEAAKMAGKTIFLATQFLKNMETNPIPSIAEEIDLYHTLKKGIHGIQLSEETAIGKYPVECVQHVFDMYRSVCQPAT